MKKWIAFVLAMVLALSLTGCKASDYKKAVSAMEDGFYSDAAITLEALGDYKDSAELLRKCRYTLAEQSFEAGSYTEAKSAFQALADYKDSANYIKKCDYNLAVDAYEAGEYQQALEVFRTLEGFSDSNRYITQCENAILTDKLEGEWVSDVLDLTDFFLKIVAAVDENMAVLLESKGAKYEMTVDVTFVESGFCTQSASVADVESLLEIYNTVVRSYVLASIEASLAESNFTLQDLYDELGTDDLDVIYQDLFGSTLDELVESYGFMEYIQYMEDSMSMECTYVIKDGQIHCNSDVFCYDAETDTLTAETDEATSELLGISVLTFHRK